MPKDPNKYIPGKFKNCDRCVYREGCKKKQDLAAMRCKKYKPDFKLILAQIKVNEQIRIANHANRRYYNT